MIAVPGSQRQDAGGEPCGLSPEPDAGIAGSAVALNQTNNRQRQRNGDGGFFAERGQSKPESGKPWSNGLPGQCIACRQRVDQTPECAGRGEDVCVGQCALRKPDGVESGQQDGPEGDGGDAGEAQGQPPYRRQP